MAIRVLAELTAHEAAELLAEEKAKVARCASKIQSELSVFRDAGMTGIVVVEVHLHDGIITKARAKRDEQLV